MEGDDANTKQEPTTTTTDDGDKKGLFISVLTLIISIPALLGA